MSRKNLVTVKKNKRGEKPLIVVVSTKVSKKATERNKIKRRVREIFREHPPKEGYKVFVNPEAKNATYQELKKEIEKQLT